jgi:hypothetical protein
MRQFLTMCAVVALSFGGMLAACADVTPRVLHVPPQCRGFRPASDGQTVCSRAEVPQ